MAFFFQFPRLAQTQITIHRIATWVWVIELSRDLTENRFTLFRIAL